jgi:hypothetical protein
MEALESLPEGNPLKDNPAYQAVGKRHYVRVPKIVSITRPEEVLGFGGSDSSSVRTKATNRPSRRCTRSKPDIYQRCRKTAKGEFAPGGSPRTSVASNDTPGLRG